MSPITRPDWELREEFGEVGLPAIPDLFTVVACSPSEGPRTAALAVEVDLGTETLRVLERKVLAYDSLASGPDGLFGHRDFGLAVALGNPGRERAVRQLIDRHWGGWWVVWTEADGPGSAIAGVLDVLAGHHRPPVTNSRNGNGSLSPLSTSVSTVRSTLSREL